MKKKSVILALALTALLGVAAIAYAGWGACTQCSCKAYVHSESGCFECKHSFDSHK